MTVPPPAVSYCDWMAFVTDVTIPDGTVLQPNETFVKTWRIKNIGTCAWNTNDVSLTGNTISIGAAYAPKMNMSRFKEYAGLFADNGDFDIPAHYALGMSFATGKSATGRFLARADRLKVQLAPIACDVL